MLFKAIVCPSCQSTDIVKHGPPFKATVYTQVECKLEKGKNHQKED
jgi:transposase-like protein